MLMYKEDVEHWHNNNTQLNYGEFFHDAGINKVHETGNLSTSAISKALC